MSRQSNFAQKVYRAGLDAGLPDHLARLAASQASLETGYGKSVRGNNFFGIKAGRSWTGKRQNLTTHEEYDGKRVKIKDSFRAYDNPADSLRDWAHLLKRKFPNAYNSKNINEAIAGLKTGIYGAYATDSDYGAKLLSINEKYVGSPQYDQALGISGLPPQRPATALSAVDQFASSPVDKLPKLAYKQSSTSADVFDKGRERFEGITSPMPPPRPQNKEETLLGAEVKTNPAALEMAGRSSMKIPDPMPQSRSFFPELPEAPSALQSALNDKAAKMRPPTPIAPPTGLQDQELGFFEKFGSDVRQKAPNIFNAIHDIGGQVDGFKENANRRIRTDLSRAVYGPSGQDVTLDDIRASGLIAGGNGYLYRKIADENDKRGYRYVQSGKLGTDDAKELGVLDPQAGRSAGRARTETSRIWDVEQKPQGIFNRDDKPKRSFFDRLFGRK